MTLITIIKRFMTSIKSESAAFNLVNEYLKEHYPNLKVTDVQLNTIIKEAFSHLKNTGKGMKRKYRKGFALGVQEKQTLIQAVKDILVSPDTPWNPSVASFSETQQLFFDLMRGNAPPITDLIKHPSLLKAIVWKKNPELLDGAKTLVQEVLLDIHREIRSREITANESLHFEIMIGDILSLFPFLDPKKENSLTVPIQINGIWQLIDYQVEPIPITPKWMGSPYMAYGLVPKNNPEAPPLLLYKGTTYPTDKGFLMSLLIDLNPFASVGSYGFHLGRATIKKWLESHASHSKVIVYGKSLGGAQAWRTALYFPSYVKKVMAYGAPGPSSRDRRKLQRILKNRPKLGIHFFYQKGDPIPLIGKTTKTGIKYYLILSGKPQKGILAHAHMFSTHENSTILSHASFHKNKKWQRRGTNILTLAVSLIAFPILLTIAIVYNALNQARKFLSKQISQLLSPSLREHSSLSQNI